MTNDVCKGCEIVRNCLNGMWCTRHKRYVQYHRPFDCEKANNNEQQKGGENGTKMT